MKLNSNCVTQKLIKFKNISNNHEKNQSNNIILLT